METVGARQPPGPFLGRHLRNTVATQLPRSCHTIATQLPHSCHKVNKGFLAVARFLRDSNYTNLKPPLWRVFADSTGFYMWQLCGNCVATVWRLCGDCVATEGTRERRDLVSRNMPPISTAGDKVLSYEYSQNVSANYHW